MTHGAFGAQAAAAGYDIVVIGTSWGGLHALTAIVRELPPTFSLPVAVVQHRGKDAPGLLAELLQDATPLIVCDVEDKEAIAPGHVYLAPPDYHLMVEHGHFSLSVDPLVRFSRPSIDVMFETAAESYGRRTVGVVLTGANEDGSLGLRRIADRGGLAIVQDPRTAEVPIMPRAAMQAVPEAEVIPIHRIGARLVELGAMSAAAPPASAPAGTAGPTEPARRSLWPNARWPR